MFEYFFSSLAQLIEPGSAAIMLGALIFGLVFGTLPGLSVSMAIAIILPLTFAMTPQMGIAALIATYVGGVSGGLVSATLLRIPGTPASIATTFDGYPLAMKGQAVKALLTGFVASAFGGLFSLVILVALAPVIASYAVRIGAQEYATLTVAALTLVVVLSPGNTIRGCLALLLGMAFAFVGFAPIDAQARMSFGNIDIMAGIGIIPFMVGIFAIAQMMREVSEPLDTSSKKFDLRGAAITAKEFFGNLVNMLRSALIGVGIGILPGIGGTASNLVAYGAARQASKEPETFGKGNVGGIYACETANNASVGGALLPLITLGIPGDGTTAILIGGFTVHGLQPGPLLYSQNPDIIAMIYAAFLLATVALLVIQIFTVKVFPSILLIQKYILIPILILLMVVGTFVSENRAFDLWLMLAFGVIGYLLERNKFPLAPLVLGFVLGPILELNTRRALMFSGGDWSSFVTRPASAAFLVLAVLVLGLAIRQGLKKGSS